MSTSVEPTLATPPRAPNSDPPADQAARLRSLVEANAGTEVPRSTPTGVVSFRPRPVSGPTLAPAAPAVMSPPITAPIGRDTAPRLARAIAVTSGKGGVGKSNLAVNLAVAMSQLGKRVCLLDADLGMANADVLCNVTPRLTLQHVVDGRCRLADVMVLAPGGFRLIPGASGVAGMADMNARERGMVLRQLAMLERVADVILIDTAAGISTNVLGFAAAAHTTLVATTPEPTAVTDAYGMVKSLLRESPDVRIRLIVNMASGLEEAQGVYERMNRVVSSFLKQSIEFGGWVPLDPTVTAAVRYRLPFSLATPDSPATLAVRGLAERLLGCEPEPKRGFFGRLAAWFGSGEDPSA
jgi:flagellar biosynthesis protein FlhG